ncbi:ATP-binding protein [Streptomyces deccanensis]|uniref:ATP-binding protein n=1 Tax=Streptomyces deccanensis TaxID=424188 RepID=UPI001EFA9BCF|nr:ATP-binding protein [Streptomyces deccanensis]ULR48179.1 ATP-binding protein [Streptomyces deccanensis]
MISVERSRLFRMAVPAHPSCAAGVRRTVAAHLARWELSAIVDDAVLATDELFANAVRHASADPADTIAVVLEHSGCELRVTLADPSPVPPRPRTVTPSAESGRGLSIVSALADDWGTEPPEPGDTGKRVWFSLAVREPV